MPCDEPDAPSELMAPAMFCIIPTACQEQLASHQVLALTSYEINQTSRIKAQRQCILYV